MSNPLVKFYPEKMRPPINPDASIMMDTLEVKAGENSFSDAEFESLKKHPDFDFFIKNGMLSLVAAEVASETKPESEGQEEEQEESEQEGQEESESTPATTVSTTTTKKLKA